VSYATVTYRCGKHAANISWSRVCPDPLGHWLRGFSFAAWFEDETLRCAQSDKRRKGAAVGKQDETLSAAKSDKQERGWCLLAATRLFAALRVTRRPACKCRGRLSKPSWRLTCDRSTGGWVLVILSSSCVLACHSERNKEVRSRPVCWLVILSAAKNLRLVGEQMWYRGVVHRKQAGHVGQQAALKPAPTPTPGPLGSAGWAPGRLIDTICLGPVSRSAACRCRSQTGPRLGRKAAWRGVSRGRQ
jgi:hypothetical protein